MNVSMPSDALFADAVYAHVCVRVHWRELISDL